ncbi:MAG: TonB-dependent receptor [Crocinitomicaceae bacterium]|jgi:TonB-dependent receptor|nr:TonB-dependent receptor [Crocinitomicaceae bacterium]
MKKIALLNVFVFMLLFVYAQTGTVEGTVIQKNGDKTEALYSVNVVLVKADGTVLKGARTDFDGKYSLKFEAGTYKVRFSYVGLEEQLLDVKIEAGQTVTVDASMESVAKNQKEVTVTGIRAKTSEAAVVEEIKKDQGVKSSMGSEQIASTGSADTKEVLSKMSGVTSSQSGGIIFVRGMGDRYNTAYLNGLPLVSPNPELRVMPMDLIPTSIIDVLDVSKMMAPNMYGDFAGGAINIRTKKIFKSPKINFTVGTSTNSQVTGREFNSYAGAKSDYFGFDNGTRAIPEAVKKASMQRADEIFKQGLYNSADVNQGTGFSNNMNPLLKTAMPGSNFRIEGGNYFRSQKEGHADRGFGFLAMLAHSVSYQQLLGQSRYINAQNKLEYNFDTKSDVFSTSTVGMASVLFDLSKKSSVHFNYLMINNSDDQVAQSWGYHRDYNDGGQELYGRRYTFSQNKINVFQLLGEQKLLDKRLKINWGTSYSLTENLVPDRRQITALYSDREKTTRYSLLALDANHTHRFFSTLDEKEAAAHVDLSWTLSETKENDTTTRKLELLAGLDYRAKDRNFEFRQFNYLAKPLADEYSGTFDISRPDNYLNDANHDSALFRIEESANPGNGYQATQSVMGGNLGLSWKTGRRLELIPSLRVENGFQSVINRKQTQANIKEVNIVEGLNLMPAFTLKYEMKPNRMLRFGASRTIIRPKFFEVAPFEYLAQVVGMVQVGNPELQNGTNYNLDLRYELYTRKSADMLIFGVFGKQLVNPIEQVQRPAASGQIISFDNTKNGTVAGAEIEYAKELTFLVSKEKRKESRLKNYSIAGNFAYIYSRIDVDDTTGFTTNSIRPLQGASPYLANFTLKYERKFDKKPKVEGSEEKEDRRWVKLMSGMSFSYASKTLYVVGIQGIGDQYLFPSYHLNWTNRLSFSNDMVIAFTFRNILNNKYQVMQQDMVNEGKWQTVSAYRKGIDFQCSLTYAFKVKKHKHVKED